MHKKKVSWSFSNQKPLLSYAGIHTVCEESRCPNRHECSQSGIATFLIGGRVCTRSCRFCHIETGKPLPVAQIAAEEQKSILEYVEKTATRYVVITSVTRDDAEKDLALHFASITRELKKLKVKVELLIPDFHLNKEYLSIIAEAEPDVIAHNLETVRNKSKEIRPQAEYDRSMAIYDFYHQHYPGLIIKAGIMVGLGETLVEVKQLLKEAKNHHVDIITIGQYMRPSLNQAQVKKIYTEKEFEMLDQFCETVGFKAREVAPYVRSSYMAVKSLEALEIYKKRAVG